MSVYFYVNNFESICQIFFFFLQLYYLVSICHFFKAVGFLLVIPNEDIHFLTGIFCSQHWIFLVSLSFFLEDCIEMYLQEIVKGIMYMKNKSKQIMWITRNFLFVLMTKVFTFSNDKVAYCRPASIENNQENWTKYF